MTVSPDSMEKELCKYGGAISGEIMQKKYWGMARIDLLINSPLFAKLRGMLRKYGTGSHAPDRSIKIPRRQSPLCANNGIGLCHFTAKKTGTREFVCDYRIFGDFDGFVHLNRKVEKRNGTFAIHVHKIYIKNKLWSYYHEYGF